ncbi:MAG TPA: nucleotide pyrophosphatase/phosphodiesterase family protein [Nocardioidaceae bacterium]|nr:nucleotide pyrophosphatase/phosphodiesterase family protein [Nocardioidaceae bacterium]
MSDDFIAPAYEDRSLGDVLPAVAKAIGVDAGFHETTLVLPEARRYVVFLVDGLGYELLRAHPEEAPFLHSLLDGQAPATVGVPSTTATSLTSLGTALSPGSHGILGFTTRIPGTDRLLNHLLWDDKSLDARDWQPHPTAFGRLAAAGVHSTVVNKREFAGSGLTVAGNRGAEFVGANKVGERLAAVVAVSAQTPSVTYMYDGDLDWTGHKYGVASMQWEQQLCMIDAAAEHLRETLPADTRILVVADHGMVDSPLEKRIDVDEQPELQDGVALVGGEARFRHLYCRGGAVDDVIAAWTAVLGDRAQVIGRDDASALGWFGALDPQMRPRLGDVMVACRGDFAVQSLSAFPYETKLLGMHGSLTPAEMLIPVLVA